jgi:hypothetical protein
VNIRNFLGASAVICISHLTAYASTIGPPVIQRALVDGATGYDSVYQGAFSNVGEMVTSFSFFNNNPANTGWITPLILSFQGGRVWQVTGIGASVQNTGAGLQTDSFVLLSGSSTIVDSTYTFGWWNGRFNGGVSTFNKGVIQFDTAASSPGFGESCPTPNCGSGGNIVPVAGNNITFGNNFSGPAGGLSSGSGRVYSIEFTTTAAATTPEPSSLILLGAGLLALVFKRTRARRARPVEGAHNGGIC